MTETYYKKKKKRTERAFAPNAYQFMHAVQRPSNSFRQVAFEWLGRVGMRTTRCT